MGLIGQVGLDVAGGRHEVPFMDPETASLDGGSEGGSNSLYDPSDRHAMG